MDVDRAGLQKLTRDECMQLLTRVRIGRVGFSAKALPVVLPVSFALDGEGVVIRVRSGSQIETGAREAIVAFEADDIDPSEGRAWSVSVTGTASAISDAAELARARGLDLGDWGGDGVDQFIRISLDLMSGRRGTTTPGGRLCKDNA